MHAIRRRHILASPSNRLGFRGRHDTNAASPGLPSAIWWNRTCNKHPSGIIQHDIITDMQLTMRYLSYKPPGVNSNIFEFRVFQAPSTYFKELTLCNESKPSRCAYNYSNTPPSNVIYVQNTPSQFLLLAHPERCYSNTFSPVHSKEALCPKRLLEEEEEHCYNILKGLHALS